MVLKYRATKENSYNFMTQNILALDTALNGCNVAVLKGGREGSCFTDGKAMMRGQSEVLVPMVQGVMEQAGLMFSDLHMIVTTIGPGAFTGLRIGLSTARSFGAALDIPVIGLTTMEVLAAQYEGGRPLALILETKREDFYVQVFGREQEPLSEASVMAGADLAGMLKEFGDIALGGDGAGRFIAQEKADYEVVAGLDVPDPAVMARLGLGGFEAGETREAVPLYLRGADVSVRKTPLRVLASS